MRGCTVVSSLVLVGAACGGHAATVTSTPDGSLLPNASSDTGSDTGQVVYDANQNVYWLADANLAGDPVVRARLGAVGLPINPNGTMDYATAQAWVTLLNHYDAGQGYLGHNDWQLPVTPPQDPSCAVLAGGSGNSFGPSCKGSALGALYSVLLGKTYPDSVVPGDANTIGPIHNLQPSFYWTSGVSADGSNAQTFTFATDLPFMNTTKYNYFPVLPMIAGPIGVAPTGTATLLPYSTGAAAGKAFWDPSTHTTWLADADLARSDALAISGTTTINTNNGALMPPLVDASGAMLLSTASTWVSALNATSYAGASTGTTGAWTLPAVTDLKRLFADLGLAKGDPVFISSTGVGQFQNLQPFFYWACMRDMAGSSASPCDGTDAGTALDGVTPMEWSFDFESGFQGTDENTKQFYVMVYRPGP